MGFRQTALAELLTEAGHPVAVASIPRPTAADLSAPVGAEVQRIYWELGGILPGVLARVGAWDLTVGTLAIELDEERHFNRYRLLTMTSSLYGGMKRFPLRLYREYCVAHEQSCLSAAGFGGYWSNSSCSKQFGPSGRPGELSGPGSSRWKQRAFYDFLKDLAPILIGVHVARVAVWDRLPMEPSISVGEALEKRFAHAAGALWQLIVSRAESNQESPVD